MVSEFGAVLCGVVRRNGRAFVSDVGQFSPEADRLPLRRNHRLRAG